MAATSRSLSLLPHAPYVFGNFVTTLDGVISYRIPGQSGGATISGSNPGDRFIMGLLRASADAVVVGAGTVHDVDPEHLWVPSFTYPKAKDLYREYRVSVLGKPEQPLIAIVTGTGSIDLSRALFHTPEMRVGPLLAAGLPHDPGLPDHVRHDAALAHGEGQRLLAEDAQEPGQQAQGNGQRAHRHGHASVRRVR